MERVPFQTEKLTALGNTFNTEVKVEKSVKDEVYFSGSCKWMDGRNLYKIQFYSLTISVSYINKDVLVFVITLGNAWGCSTLLPFVDIVPCWWRDNLGGGENLNAQTSSL